MSRLRTKNLKNLGLLTGIVVGLIAVGAILTMAYYASALGPPVTPIVSGGTGTSTPPGANKLYIGDANGNIEYIATSSLGISSGGSAVTSVFGRTGVVSAQTGDYTTSQVTEGSNLYYTLLRWASALAGTTTDALAEGTNHLYFTNARAISALTGQNISILNNNVGYLTSLAGAASSTALSDNNTFSGIDAFTNALSNFAGTWQTFSPSHFQTALGFTPVPNTRNVNTTYPLQGGGALSSDVTISSALGTTTSNTWGGTQTFTNTPVLGSLTGFIKAASGVLSTAAVNLASDVTGTLPVANGGTASTTLTGILKGNGTNGVLTAVGDTDYQKPISLTTSGSSGAATFSGDTLNIPQYAGTTYTGAFPISVSGSSISFGGLGTSTNLSQGQVPYVTGANTFGQEATGSVTCAGTASCPTGSYVLGNALTITGSAGTSASSTLLGDNNTFSGNDSFTNASSNFAGTWQGFNPSHFLTSAVTSVTATYPVQSSGGNTPAISLAFGTTTSNIWAATQTFTNSPTFSTLTPGTVNSTSGGSLYTTGTSSLSNGTGISFSGTAGALIGGSSLTITNTGVTSLTAGSGISLSGSTGGVTITGTGLTTDPNWLLTNSGNTLTATTTGIGVLVNSATSTITNLFSLHATSTNATSTNLFATTASTTNLYLATGACTGSNALTVTTSGQVACGAITGFDTFAYPFPGNATTSSLTLGGFLSTASSTINASTTITGALTLTGATTTTSNGINIAAGCFAINGSCISLSGSGTVTSVGTSYPVTGGPFTTSGTIALAFGTTTSNIWAGTQTFTNSPTFSTLGAGTVNATSGGSLYNTATSSISNGAGISFTGTPGALIGGSALTITNSGVTSLSAGSGISLSGSTGGVTISSTGLTTDPNWALTNSGNTLTATTTGIGLLVNSATSTITNLFSLHATSTNATSTNLFATTASTTNLFLATGVCSGSSALNVSASGQVACGAITGFLTGNQTITLSGDVSGSGATAITTTIGANKVTLGDLATLSANSLIGNPTGSTATPVAVATSSLGLTVSSFASSNISQWTNNANYLTAAITGLGPAGQTQIGPTQTLATTTSSFNGLTAGLTITAAGNTQTFQPTLSGTLNVSGGGTGATTLGSGQVLFGNGTGIVGSEATGTIAQGTGITVSGTGYDLGAGVTITNAGVTSLAAGNGISVSGSTGGVTVTDTNGYPFTTLTDFGLTSSGTTTPIWAKGALFASSTISAPNQIDNYNSTNGTTTNATSTNLYVSGTTVLGSGTGLVLTTSGKVSNYGGATSCTNQFFTGLSASGASTCGSVNNADWSGTQLSVANGGTGDTTLSAGQLLYGSGTGAVLTVATSSVTNGTGISLSGTAGALVGGTSLTITNSGVISNSCPGGFLTCSGTNPSSFTLGTLGIGNGGTGTTFFSNSSLIAANSSGILTSTTTLSVAAFSATSTSATSTIAYGLNVAINGGCLAVNGTCVSTSGGGGGSPGGSNGQIQYNNSSSFGGWANSFINASLGTLGIGTSTPEFPLDIASSTAQQLHLSDGLNDNGFGFRAGGGNLYISTTSPSTFGTSTPSWITFDASNIWGQAAIGIGSSSPLYSFTDSAGAILEPEWMLSTSTSIAVDLATSSAQVIRIGSAATTITLVAPVPGAVLRLTVANPGQTAGAITWAASGCRISWPGGTTPTQTTTANVLDLWTFSVTNGTSTPICEGAQIANYP